MSNTQQSGNKNSEQNDENDIQDENIAGNVKQKRKRSQMERLDSDEDNELSRKRPKVESDSNEEDNKIIEISSESDEVIDQQKDIRILYQEEADDDIDDELGIAEGREYKWGSSFDGLEREEQQASIHGVIFDKDKGEYVQDKVAMRNAGTLEAADHVNIPYPPIARVGRWIENRNTKKSDKKTNGNNVIKQQESSFNTQFASQFQKVKPKPKLPMMFLTSFGTKKVGIESKDQKQTSLQSSGNNTLNPISLIDEDNNINNEQKQDSDQQSPSFTSFIQLGLPQGLVGLLIGRGYTEPTPIQQQAIPVIMKDQDVIATAPTGSGKTIAYVTPALCHAWLQREARAERNQLTDQALIQMGSDTDQRLRWKITSFLNEKQESE